jgi:hypothetical protein
LQKRRRGRGSRRRREELRVEIDDGKVLLVEGGVVSCCSRERLTQAWIWQVQTLGPVDVKAQPKVTLVNGGRIEHCRSTEYGVNQVKTGTGTETETETKSEIQI